MNRLVYPQNKSSQHIIIGLTYVTYVIFFGASA